MTLIKALYIIAACMLALYGLQSGILSVLYLRHRKRTPSLPEVNEWPSVTIQLPLYNELHVVEHLLRAITQIRYPRDKLQIQLLDDSTDETTQILEREVAHYSEVGHNIELVRRPDRRGFKAGALEYGLPRATGEFIAIFDADFVPPPDFLLRTVPYFSADEQLGFVQTRWGHTNQDFSGLTRAQALALDGHFIVEQTGRQRGALFLSFNGTAGIWRRSCIESGGGWSADTLCEDLDLSFRAEMAGWHGLFLPDVESPAEIPPQMAALKRQQARWARGSVQCLRKLGWRVLTSSKPLGVRLMGLIHLGAYLAHPMTLILTLTTPLLLLWGHSIDLPLKFLGVFGLCIPVALLIGQKTLRPDWPRRLLSFPILMLTGIGLSWNNTAAILAGLAGRPAEFKRTPKFRSAQGAASWELSRYALGLDWSNVGELFMMLYLSAALIIAIQQGDLAVISYLALYLCGFAFVAFYDVAHYLRLGVSEPRARRKLRVLISNREHA